MIRARMSFGGCFISRPPSESELAERKLEAERCEQRGYKFSANMDPTRHEMFAISLDDAIAYLEEKPNEWRTVQVNFSAVYTPDPTNPNMQWARATPSGRIELSIQNPGALRGYQSEIEKAESVGRKNGTASTKEFYVDMYAAPATD